MDVKDHPSFTAKGRNYEFTLYRNGDREVRVVPADIRAIQLAKSACYSGAKLLMDEMGVDGVDRIYLAGAFGSYIDVKYAMAIGMIPDCPLENVSSAGNAAGTGARIALLSAAAREEIERVIRSVEKVETRHRAEVPGLFRLGHQHSERGGRVSEPGGGARGRRRLDMDRPRSPQIGPYAVMVEEGRTYRWCSCGAERGPALVRRLPRGYRLRADRVRRADYGRVLHVRLQGLGQQAVLLRQLHRPRGPRTGRLSATRPESEGFPWPAGDPGTRSIPDLHTRIPSAKIHRFTAADTGMDMEDTGQGHE